MARGRGGRGRGRGRGGKGDDESGSDSETAVAKTIFGLNPNMYTADGVRKESGATVTFAKPNYQKGARDILMEKIDIHYKGHTILENATIKLDMGHRYGLIAPNGAGKSTFLKVMGLGELPFPDGFDWYYLQKEVDADDKLTALQAVLKVDVEKELLEKEMEQLSAQDQEDETVASRLEDIYTRLDELDADTSEARAAKILFGLGFTPEMQNRPTAGFSGGWRMRISLAQALFINPTLLLLDEPTNHLDIEAVVWLERHLSNFKKCLVLVSHSQDFLNSVCTNIMHMQRGRLVYYDGNYDQHIQTREEKESHQTKRFQWQQDQMKSMKEYIARFGHGNKKLARQAQSKEKTLNKMVQGGLETAVIRDANVTFEFPCAGTLAPPVIQFTDVAFAYPGCKPLFTKLNVGLDLDSRICICGPNGAGKTTLTKLICRDLDPTSGFVAKNAHCSIARFHQHFADQIDPELTPLEYLRKEYPDVMDPMPLRAALGRMGVSGRLQMSPIGTLSDGQKTRVVFAWIALKRPHMLILDEPTNHLDIESIDALSEALMDFEGAIIVVSHDLRLIAQVADEIWNVDKGQVEKFQGDIADYKEHVQKEVMKMEKEFNARGGAAKAATV